MSPSKVSTIDFTKFFNIVDGKQRSSKNVHNGVDPTTGEKLWDVPVGSQQDVDDAVASAQKAFKTWSRVSIEKRREPLVKFKELYSQYEQEFIDLLCAETGKPRAFATAEVMAVQKFIDHHATIEIPVEEYDDAEKHVKTMYQPLGVCAGICPWNFPLILSLGKVAPAVVAGNAIIIKPSPYTPYTALKMFELAQEVFPPGVVQVIGGDDRLGPMLTAHPDIAKVSFTGSIATGKKIMAACANTLKRVTLELGGNDACIVMADADIEKHAPQVAMGAFFNSGQVCVATKRIYIHEKIYKPFLEAMVNFTKTIKVGNSNEEGVMLGPIQNKMQYDKVTDYFADSKKSGYTFAHGKDEVEQGKGYFVQPTILDNPPSESRIMQEEPFGPIVPCQSWSDLDDVIERANSTKAGLAGSVFSTDVKQAQAVAERMDTGSIFINGSVKPDPQFFFGGHKESGIGGEFGKAGILAYCNATVIHTMK
ncbi:MAG: hypothetical protein M1828_006844 [Chrysothrix sp. TS-e1954]|nr:MAG: hypothetical protein M1828_006844 [Chrysothrix sp. TS-e1954]